MPFSKNRLTLTVSFPILFVWTVVLMASLGVGLELCFYISVLFFAFACVLVALVGLLLGVLSCFLVALAGVCVALAFYSPAVLSVLIYFPQCSFRLFPLCG